MNKKMTLNKKNNRGIAPLIIVLIITLLAGGGTVAYLKATNQPVSLSSLGIGGGASQDLDEMKIETGSIDFNLSDVEPLSIAPISLEMPRFSAPKIEIPKTSLNTNIGFDESRINIGMPNLSNITPSISIPSIPSGSIPSNISIPTSIPTGQTGIPTEIPTNTNTVPPTTNSAPTGAGAPSVDCSAFASIPSCSMAGPGESMCKQCFPNK